MSGEPNSDSERFVEMYLHDESNREEKKWNDQDANTNNFALCTFVLPVDADTHCPWLTNMIGRDCNGCNTDI